MSYTPGKLIWEWLYSTSRLFCTSKKPPGMVCNPAISLKDRSLAVADQNNQERSASQSLETLLRALLAEYWLLFCFVRIGNPLSVPTVFLDRFSSPIEVAGWGKTVVLAQEQATQRSMVECGNAGMEP
jgi:hypothetical protein